MRDESLRGKLQLYALLAPHIGGYGAGNSGECSEIGDIKLLRAQRGDVHLLMACGSGFTRRSAGYVGFSDGWQDLMHDFKMDWEFRKAENGNIALTGEINLPENGEFMIAVAFGRSYQTTAIKLFQSLVCKTATTLKTANRKTFSSIVKRKSLGFCHGSRSEEAAD